VTCHSSAVPFPFYLVTDRRIPGNLPLVDRLRTLAEASPAGTFAVQVREKDLCANDLLQLVRDVVTAVRPRGVPVFVNDRADLAMAAGADGVHLPGNGLDPAALRRVYPGLIGVSTHSREELASLEPGMVDFATFGPVFTTPSKLPYGPPQGIGALRDAVAAARVPVFAIGGIKAETAADLKGTGIAGIAAISAVLASSDPVTSLESLIRLASVPGC